MLKCFYLWWFLLQEWYWRRQIEFMCFFDARNLFFSSLKFIFSLYSNRNTRFYYLSQFISVPSPDKKETNLWKWFMIFSHKHFLSMYSLVLPCHHEANGGEITKPQENFYQTMVKFSANLTSIAFTSDTPAVYLPHKTFQTTLTFS